MIYPATYDITILQNATWKAAFRATQNRQQLSSIVSSGSTPVFTLPCHGLSASDTVIITGSGSIPCGISLNQPYFVMSSGLTTNSFLLSATTSGTSISASGTASGVFYAAEPLNLGFYVIDSDIKDPIDDFQVGTFSSVITDPANGAFELMLTPSGSAAIEPGEYNYDVSFTSPGGERYYWLTGVATVEHTYSRS